MVWPTYTELKTFYGDPDGNNDGLPDPAWEARSLTRIVPPYPMYWSWSKTAVKALTVNEKCAESLSRCLAEIPRTFSPTEIKKYRLDECGGAYNFRQMRGGKSLSVHSWGAAIDIAPSINWLGRTYNPSKGMMPLRAIQIFGKEGWVWGGLWKHPDAMHFQACRQ